MQAEARQPLLPSRNAAPRRRLVALVPAVLAASAALLLLAVSLMAFHAEGPTEGLQEHPPTLYYVPAKTSRPWKKQQQLVYYYLPESSRAFSMLNGSSSNSSGSSAQGSSNSSSSDFVCSVANIKALHALVQPKWDACKSNPNYQEPNKGANRRLLEWVWEPEAGEKMTAKPRYSPDHYTLSLKADRRRKPYSSYHPATSERRSWYTNLLSSLAGNQSNSSSPSGANAGSISMGDCEKNALSGACEKLASCKDPVCFNYYNEPEIEQLCGVCSMGSQAWYGCFAEDSEVIPDVLECVELTSCGSMAISQVQIGDKVLSADAFGAPQHSRVIFKHDHKDVSSVVSISYETKSLRLTPSHLIPKYSEECGDNFCHLAGNVPASTIRAGDRIYVHSGDRFEAKARCSISRLLLVVTAVSKSAAKVRYLLTENDRIVVDGMVASVFSTAAEKLETMPFHLLDRFLPGLLQSQAVASTLETILESPILQGFETLVNTFSSPVVSRHSNYNARLAASPGVSF
eukprot:756605-Hanusia_phi.AAC.5